jgi:hypothetical protein
MIKLNLIFIAMDLLTLLIYPVIYVHGRMYRLLKEADNRVLMNLSYPVLVTLDE